MEFLACKFCKNKKGEPSKKVVRIINQINKKPFFFCLSCGGKN